MNAALTLLTRSPPVNTTRVEDTKEYPAAHFTAVSAVHNVASHPEKPSVARDENETVPIPAPCTVSIADPVPARFTRRMLQTVMAPAENAVLTVPTLRPELTSERYEALTNPPTRQRSDVSDSQNDDSQIEIPRPPFPVTDIEPMPDPSKVTLTEPVSGAFARNIPLNPPPAIEKASDILPGAKPAVTDTIRVAQSPDPALQRMDVSDCHSETSQLLTPCLLTAV